MSKPTLAKSSAMSFGSKPQRNGSPKLAAFLFMRWNDSEAPSGPRARSSAYVKTERTSLRTALGDRPQRSQVCPAREIYRYPQPGEERRLVKPVWRSFEGVRQRFLGEIGADKVRRRRQRYAAFCETLQLELLSRWVVYLVDDQLARSGRAAQ